MGGLPCPWPTEHTSLPSPCVKGVGFLIASPTRGLGAVGSVHLALQQVGGGGPGPGLPRQASRRPPSSPGRADEQPHRVLHRAEPGHGARHPAGERGRPGLGRWLLTTPHATPPAAEAGQRGVQPDPASLHHRLRGGG